MLGEETDINLPGMVLGAFKCRWIFFFNLPSKSYKINTDVLVLRIRRLRLKEMEYFA